MTMLSRKKIEEKGSDIGALLEDYPELAKLTFTKLPDIREKVHLMNENILLGFLIHLLPKLMKYEDQVICTNYKFGILYCKDGQGGEREMYNNGSSQDSPPKHLLLIEFPQRLAVKPLKSF